MTGDPRLQRGADEFLVVRHNAPRGDLVARLCDAFGENIAGLVVFRAARVGHGQDRDVEGNEFARLVDGHERAFLHCTAYNRKRGHRAIGLRYRKTVGTEFPARSSL